MWKSRWLRFMFPLYNALLAPLLPGLGLYTLHRRYLKGKSAGSLAGQWGHISPEMRAFGRAKSPRVWLHAVSVGETMAARPLARALKTELPGVQIALSSTTDTGHEVALAAQKAGEIELAFYFPLDLPFVVTRVLNALNPDAMGFVETELWPNLLHLARRRGVPTFQLNGRVSDHLLASAPKLGPLWKWMSGNVTQFLMRGEEDAARLQSLGVDAAKIVVTGDVKLEAPAVSSAELRAKWRDELGLGENDRVLICGSTHGDLQNFKGEEEFFLSIAAPTNHRRLALAPRHPERFGEVAALIETKGFQVVRRSSGEKWKRGAVFLLDSVGELADFYAAGDWAFVGGSLVPRGGHNLLEPVLRGCPVCFGPWVGNFLAQRDLILSNELGLQTSDIRIWDADISHWLEQPHNRVAFEARVESALSPHRGAAARAARLMARAMA